MGRRTVGHPCVLGLAPFRPRTTRHDEVVQLIRLLASARARAVPPSLRHVTAQARMRVWTAFLSPHLAHPFQHSLMSSLAWSPSPPGYLFVPREPLSTWKPGTKVELQRTFTLNRIK